MSKSNEKKSLRSGLVPHFPAAYEYLIKQILMLVVTECQTSHEYNKTNLFDQLGEV